MMDTTTLVIFIIVLFQFILYYQIQLTLIKNSQKHIEDMLSKYFLKETNCIQSVSNKGKYSECNQNNREHGFTWAISYCIKRLREHLTAHKTNN